MKTILFIASLLLSGQQQPRPLSSIADDLDKLAAELRTRPTTVAIPCGDPVQPAITAAKGGDTIILEAGCRYVGPLTLKANAGLVTIRSSAPIPERRVTTDDVLPI